MYTMGSQGQSIWNLADAGSPGAASTSRNGSGTGTLSAYCRSETEKEAHNRRERERRRKNAQAFENIKQLLGVSAGKVDTHETCFG